MAGPTPREPRKGSSKITDFFQMRKRLFPGSEEDDEFLPMKKPKIIDPSSSLGDFKHLPPELRMLLFDKIPTDSLAAMAMSCCQLHREISNYVFHSKVGQKRFQAECLVQEMDFCVPCGKTHTTRRQSPLENFINWGVLLKVTSCGYPTRKRIRIIAEFFDAATKTMELTVNASLMKGLGKLFMQVVDNWGLIKCERVFHAVMAHDNHRLANLVRAILDALPGQMAEEEFLVRIVLRNLFLDHEFTDSKHYPFYLSLILHSFSIPHQAKLLYLLYAPVIKERIQFRALCDVVVTDAFDRTQRLWPFAHCILSLRSEKCSYPDDDIIGLIEELTTFPAPWALDNFSGVLLLMPEIASDALRARVFCGQLGEAADILNSMKMLVFRWDRQSTLEMLMWQLHDAVQSWPWTPQVKRATSRRLSHFIGMAHQGRLEDIAASNANNAETEMDLELLSYREIMLKWRETFARDSI